MYLLLSGKRSKTKWSFKNTKSNSSSDLQTAFKRKLKPIKNIKVCKKLKIISNKACTIMVLCNLRYFVVKINLNYVLRNKLIWPQYIVDLATLGFLTTKSVLFFEPNGYLTIFKIFRVRLRIFLVIRVWKSCSTQLKI